MGRPLKSGKAALPYPLAALYFGEDLSSIEEALALQKLQMMNGITHEELGQKIGKSRSYVTNAIGLLKLPSQIIDDVNQGLLTAGHARILSKLKDTTIILELRNKVIEDNLTVRDLDENLESYVLPNIGYAFSVFFHYGYCWFLPVLLFFMLRNKWLGWSKLLGLITVVYILFLAGVSHQNARFFIIIFHNIIISILLYCTYSIRKAFLHIPLNNNNTYFFLRFSTTFASVAIDA